MSCSRDEARFLTRGALALLVISLARYGGDLATGFKAPSAVAKTTILDSLQIQTRAAISEEARRARPLEHGETIAPNTAAVSDLDRLPGVGPATAARIIEARDAGLVFRRPEDLLEVRGIGPATLAGLADHLSFEGAPRSPPRRARTAAFLPPSGIEPVDLNSADVATLKGLPGVGPALAARIVEERKEGLFQGIEDLVRVHGIGIATVERLRGRAVARGIREEPLG